MTNGLRTTQVMLDRIDPNPWNPNRMGERAFAAEKESIAAFGFIDPVTLRAKPDEPGRFQIIDGEHRLRALKELLAQEPVPRRLASLHTSGNVPAILLNLTDPAAKRLTIILNETRGRPDQIALAKLLADLQSGLVEGEDMLLGLPFSEGELNDLVKLAGFDWDGIGSGDGLAAPAADAGGRRVVCALTEDDYELWRKAAALAEVAFRQQGVEMPDNEQVANGLVLRWLLLEVAQVEKNGAADGDPVVLDPPEPAAPVQGRGRKRKRQATR